MEEQINQRDKTTKELKSENENLKGVIVTKDSEQAETEVRDNAKKLSDSFHNNPYIEYSYLYYIYKIFYREPLKSRSRRLKK